MLPPAPIIRLAHPRDIHAIAQLLTELNRVEGQDAVCDADALRAALFGDAQDVKLAAFVAEIEEKTVATLLYYPGYDTLSASYGYHLADMVVAAAHRREGIGRALLVALAKQALAQKKEWVSLTALTRNDAARAFYASLGMSEVAVTFFAMGKGALARL